MVPLVGNICTIGTNGIVIFTICTNFFTNGTIGYEIGTNGTNVTTNDAIGEPRTHALSVTYNVP